MAKKTLSIITDNYDECYVQGCRRPPVTEHHLIFGKGRRKLSEKYGIKIPICAEHHNWCHDEAPKHPAFAQGMKELGQRAFEDKYKDLEFRAIFGKNYLLEEE